MLKLLLNFIFFLLCVSSVTAQSIDNNFTLKEVNSKKIFCGKTTNKTSLVNCLIKTLKKSDERLRQIENLSLKEIQKYPYYEDNYQKDDHDLEKIGWFKSGFESSRKSWIVFRNADCNSISDFQKINNRKTGRLRCLVQLTNERIEKLYLLYLISSEEKETLSVSTHINPHPCDNTVTGNTLDIVNCESQKLKRAEKQLTKLLKKIKSRIARNNFTLLIKAQKFWVEFRDADGNAAGIYESGGGTARGPFALAIKTGVTENRIAQLSRIYLKK